MGDCKRLAAKFVETEEIPYISKVLFNCAANNDIHFLHRMCKLKGASNGYYPSRST